MSKKINELTNVPDVDIAEAGCFKYILVEVRHRDTTNNQSKFVVRGNASCAYHGRGNLEIEFSFSNDLFHLADLLDIMQEQIDETKLKLDCKGGGRIRVDPQIRTISVYGYSMVSYYFN